MTKFVIGPDVALRLGEGRAVIGAAHELLAPTLLRSQLLNLLFQRVRRGEMTEHDAAGVLEHVRGLRVRLLGDRVLQRVSWQVAEKVGLVDTYDAEYIALTKLQAEALVTLDDRLAAAARTLVATAPLEALT